MPTCPPPGARFLLTHNPEVPAVETAPTPSARPDDDCPTAARSIGTLPSLLVEELISATDVLVADGSAWNETSGVGAFELEFAKSGQRFRRDPVPQAALRAAVRAIQVDAQRATEGKARAQLSHVRVAQAAGMGQLVQADSGQFSCDCLDALVAFSNLLVNELKVKLAVPRPDAQVFAAALTPQVAMPSSTSYPGGHALQMGLLEEVLGAWRPGLLPAIRHQADRGAKAREELGVHSSIDTEAGRAAGRFLGQQLVAAARSQSPSCSVWAAVFARAAEEQPQP